MKTAAMNSYQIRKNINDLEQSICKYSDLLSNVLNMQDSSNKPIKTSTAMENNKNQIKSKQQSNIKQPTRHHSALIKSSNNKSKFTNKLSSSLTSNHNNNINNNSAHIGSNYSKPISSRHHQSILKQPSSIINRPHTSAAASTTSSRLKTSLPTNTNIILQKSKSADNINRNSLNKSTSCLKKNDLNKSSNMEDMSKQLDSFNQKLNIKPENREVFLSKLLDLIKNHQEPNANDLDLESKLDSMKSEIDRLKSKLANKNNQVCSSNSSTSLQSTSSSSSSSSITFESTDANSNNINMIVSSYSDKLSQMQKQINELTMLNKNLLLEKSNRIQNSAKDMNESKNTKNEGDRQNLMTIEKLKNELRDSNERCKVLDYLLEQKTRENEQFSNLFKEIGENVSTLIKELEKNEKPTNNNISKQDHLALCTTNNKRKTDSIADSMSISVLKESLVKFQKKLNIQPNFQFQSPKQSATNNNQPTPLVINHLEKTDGDFFARDNINNNAAVNQNLVKTSKIIMTNFKKADNSATTSSDTLVDADSSFESNNLFRKNSLINKSINSRFDIEKSTINSTIFKSLTNNLMNNFEDSDESSDNDDDGYDENDGIVNGLQDLTISTMQTSNNEITTNNESIANLNIKDEDQFAEGLKMLDQKIFKVKKLLETMKNS